MKRVIIIGGGIGGISTAYYLRLLKKKMKTDVKITIISEREYFAFTPAFPHLAIGWRKLEQIILPLKNILPKLNIEFINQKAKQIIPDKNKVILENDEEQEYDYLVIATGPKFNYPENSTEYINSICTEKHAINTFTNLLKYLEKNDNKPIITGAIAGTSCFGPAYEYTLMLREELTKRNLNPKIIFITPEPFLGHFGLAGVKNSTETLTSIFKEKNIEFFTNKEIIKVENNKVIFKDVDGSINEIESGFTMLMPRFTGPEVVESAGDKVAHSVNKMVMVNQAYQNETYKNIYAVGVVVFFPPVEKTPIPTGMPKTGMMIEHMALAVANNIINDINNDNTRYTAELSAICIADIGTEGLGFFVSSAIPPRKTELYLRSTFLHHFKTIFEKYFLWKVKTGNITPFTEEKTLELLLKVHPIKVIK